MIKLHNLRYTEEYLEVGYLTRRCPEFKPGKADGEAAQLE